MHKSLHCELDLRYVSSYQMHLHPAPALYYLSSTHLFSLCHKLSWKVHYTKLSHHTMMTDIHQIIFYQPHEVANDFFIPLPSQLGWCTPHVYNILSLHHARHTHSYIGLGLCIPHGCKIFSLPASFHNALHKLHYCQGPCGCIHLHHEIGTTPPATHHQYILDACTA